MCIFTILLNISGAKYGKKHFYTLLSDKKLRFFTPLRFVQNDRLLRISDWKERGLLAVKPPATPFPSNTDLNCSHFER